MDVQLLPARDEMLESMEALYEEAFPAAERKPFQMLLDRRGGGQVELLAIRGEQGFRGLAITAMDRDLVLLDYFAVAPSQRGQGTGSRALGLIGEYYRGKRLFLEIEEPDPQAGNQLQRLKRLAFYRRNGYRDIGVRVALNGIGMLLMSPGADIAFDEYRALYERVYGPDIARLVVRREE